MEQLPKIVKQRLHTVAEAQSHPDADLLTAFAEGSLSDRERGVLFKHLAECVSCRNVIYLSNAKTASSGGTLPLGSKSRLLSWPVLRWGALSACVVIVGAAVTLRLHRQAVPAAVESRQAAEIALQDRANFEQRRLQSEDRDKLTTRIESENGMSRNIASQPSANKKRDFDSSRHATAVLHAQRGSAARARIRRDEPVNEITVTGNAPQISADPLAVVPGPVSSTAVAARQKNAKVQDNFRPPSAPPSSEMVTVEAQPLAEIAAAPSRAKDAKQPAAKEKAATAGLAGEIPDSESKARFGFQQGALMKSGLRPNLRWSISDKGMLRSSSDEGKTWQMVAIAQNAVFRVVAAVGTDVWVGGSGGTLYHSQDRGGHWTQVKPTADGRTLTADVTGIEFIDSQHGKLVTANSETWTTEDAGQNWQKK
jgi:Photosynthesis system II assembly factor YCF48/Putative zinc-finger